MNGNESKVKHINISKVIEDNQKETTEKNQRHNELWQGAKGLLDGRGQLANLAMHPYLRHASARHRMLFADACSPPREHRPMNQPIGWQSQSSSSAAAALTCQKLLWAIKTFL